MGKLIYSGVCSLDGYIEDPEGSFQFAAPSEEVHQFFNDRFRDLGTQIYGRGLYETMAVWETMGTGEDDPAVIRDFGEIWRGVDKLVISRTLEGVSTERTRLEREFDARLIQELKDVSVADLVIGGPGLAASAFDAGLVDMVELAYVPVSVGGGKPALPAGTRLDLKLLEEQRFENGFVHLRYEVVG